MQIYSSIRNATLILRWRSHGAQEDFMIFNYFMLRNISTQWVACALRMVHFYDGMWRPRSCQLIMGNVLLIYTAHSCLNLESVLSVLCEAPVFYWKAERKRVSSSSGWCQANAACLCLIKDGKRVFFVR